MSFKSVGPAEDWYCKCPWPDVVAGDWKFSTLRRFNQPYCEKCGCTAPWAEWDDDITPVRAEPID